MLDDISSIINTETLPAEARCWLYYGDVVHVTALYFGEMGREVGHDDVEVLSVFCCKMRKVGLFVADERRNNRALMT